MSTKQIRPASDEPPLNIHEAAAMQGVSVSTIRRQIKSGALPAVKVAPHSVRIRRDDLEKAAVPAGADPVETYIQKLVDSAPPLTPAQAEKIASLLRTSGNGSATA